MCDEAVTTVQTPGGESEEFPIQLGLYQGSTLKPITFLIANGQTH